jgi:RND family efflux transporter MFP subunit
MQDDAQETIATPNVRRVLMGLGAGAACLLALGVGLRLWDAGSDASKPSAKPVVSTLVVKPEAGEQSLALPANLEAWNSAQIFPRTNGYIHAWLVDIGDRVRAGQVLAEIDTPDVAAQLAQARADYQAAKVNAALAQATAGRFTVLLKQDSVSSQDAENKQADYQAKAAALTSAAANVHRLAVQQGFARLTAPFAGVITTRSAQTGALVVANAPNAVPLFTVQDKHIIRAYVHVPQRVAWQIHNGMSVALNVPEAPGAAYPARVTRMAGAIDAQSGSELVELQAENSGMALKPGGYAQAVINLAGAGGAAQVLRVPSTAALAKANGVSLVQIDAHNHAHFLPVKLGDDDGKSVVVLSGAAAGMRIVAAPSDSLQEGETVHWADMKK